MPPRKSTGKGKAPSARTRRSIGRKPVITDEVQARLCDLLRLAMPRVAACDAVGISTRTFDRWSSEGEEAQRLVLAMAEEGLAAPKLTPMQERQRLFWLALQEANGGGQLAYLTIVANAATGGLTHTDIVRVVEHVETPQPDGTTKVEAKVVEEKRRTRTLLPDPRMALEILKRRWPADWSPPERREVSGPDGKPLEVQTNVAALGIDDDDVQRGLDALLEKAARDGLTPPGNGGTTP